MNTFPTMNGEWVPTGVLALSPWWLNLFENAVTIQFVHRCIAVLVVAIVFMLTMQARKQDFKTGVVWAVLATLLQVLLGIAALLLVVPVALGAAHQAGAVALLSSTIWLAHLARRMPRGKAVRA
jgi:cytochrome c oxidase assembly protein subunit 15